MLATIVPISVITTNAAMADESEDYELGTKIEGSSDSYFKFNLTQKSHIILSCKYEHEYYDNWNIYDTSGRIVCKDIDIRTKAKYNPTTEQYSTIYSRNLNKGTYYLEVDVYGHNYYTFTLDAEPAIKLPKGTLTSVKSSKKGQFVAKCKSAADAIGYQFQYSLNERFKSGVKTLKSSVAKKTVKKLKVGKRYYVRVRPYTIYTDGTYVFGQYSLPKSVKIKK